jgi:hypothetical protein
MSGNGARTASSFLSFYHPNCILPVMLYLLDIFFTILHLIIIFFNLFGWIPVRTRKAHLICIALTGGSWFLLGLWFGIGYCPITEWQWQIKEQLGETNLPASFVKYYGDNLTGKDLSPSVIDTLTAVFFAVAAVMSLYMNFIRKRNRTALNKT